MDELVEIPIKHPGINPKIIHRAILVTNGEINSVVKTNITDRNTSTPTDRLALN